MKHTDAGCEYVADDLKIGTGAYDVSNYREATLLVTDYLEGRLTAVFDRWPERATLMLSGGIDSILIATVVARLRPDSLALTFSQEGDDNAAKEAETAAAVARQLGLEHQIVEPDSSQLEKLLAETVRKLGTSEPWEVLAGVVLVAINQAAQQSNANGPIISGGGADALFLGGADFETTGFNDMSEVVAQWDKRVRAKIESNFTRKRFIPDFYERLLNDPDRHIQVWQTEAAVRLAQRLHPQVVRGENLSRDKDLFRRMVVKAGLAESVVALDKNPMQVSSGGLNGIVRLARQEMNEKFGARTYSDPLVEPLDFTVSRLWLGSLENGD
ncbi:asparagine synthase-related protein [Corynebacterium cystitidis]|uniref:asparagine synthase (glutamine-hydrolyzing) n=1 Tax=Corynebacterium cystitidis DSM 20524 TaxID=1121357 RepID=A0A1H9PB59_9CORY|nr:asparagine synthase-related protein [Corynebacterium cystitidis]WJY82559.1 Asparagine synthase [Corynebacterium cystitidis DSM 20524]SER45397.1 asparagine synthase (glutamine-hydrolysing) [Corynebacterium cystitidis DSM 20524]SNV73430.1 glutamine amidotransferase [Corynebacterium cystitidis]